MVTRLAQNLYIRHPVGANEPAVSRGEPGYVFAVPTNYRWDGLHYRGRTIRCIAPLEAYLHEHEVYLGDGGIHAVVDKEFLAPTVGGFTDEELGRLVELREEMVKIKIDLLRADAVYTGCDLLADTIGSKEEVRNLPPGGLPDILRVVGHYEKEIKIGTYAAARDRLECIIDEGVCAKFVVVMQP